MRSERLVLSRIVRAAAACVALIILPGTSLAQGAADSRIDASLARFTAGEWATRATAFYDLFTIKHKEGLRGRTELIGPTLAEVLEDSPSKSQRLRKGLIDLLATENHLAQPGVTPRFTEDFSNYWGDLVAAVASLRDKRAAQVLLAVVDSGDLATNGLAALGKDGLDALLGRQSDSRALVRQGVTRGLSQMTDHAVNVTPMDVATVARLKAALVRASTDDNHWVRVSAIPGLARLPGADVTAVLENLARHDPYSRPGEEGQPNPYFLVRETAKAALRTTAR